MQLKIKKLKDNARIPKRATDGAAGMDLYACIPEAITLAPGQLAVIPTGIVQDRFTRCHVWLAHHDLAVKSAGAHDRRIQDVHTVCSRHDDDALVL